MEATESLFKCLEQVPDPRRARGVRHPFQAILRLTLLGLVCGQTTMAHIALFARMHWPALKEPLGYEFRIRSTVVLEHLAVIIVSHYDADMRTTLTIDDDIADALRERARLLDLPFKQVVNDALRRGMSPGTREAPIVKR